MLLTTENSIDLVYAKIIRRISGGQLSNGRVVSGSFSHRVSKSFAKDYIETAHIHTIAGIHKRKLYFY